MPFERGKSGNPATQWQPGVPPNPAGRPKSTLKAAIEAAITKEEIGTRVAEIARSNDEQAALAAIKYVSERTEGKVPETRNVHVSGRVKVQLRWADDEQQ